MQQSVLVRLPAPSRTPAACDRLVEAGGLSPLFALFMGKSKVKGPKGHLDKDVEQEVEERCVSLLSNLFQVRHVEGSRGIGV